MREFDFTIHGNKYHAKIKSIQGDSIKVAVNGVTHTVTLDKQESKTPVIVKVKNVAPTTIETNKKTSAPNESTFGAVRAPLPGVVAKINCKVGDSVNLSDTVLLLEAMKMQNEVHASITGVVKEILVKEGDSVSEGQELVKLSKE